LSNGPNSASTGWLFQARNHNDNGSYTVTAYAICANVAP
jgi:hypothetical protein